MKRCRKPVRVCSKCGRILSDEPYARSWDTCLACKLRGMRSYRRASFRWTPIPKRNK